MSQEELYLKNQLVVFYKKFSYVGGIILTRATVRKRLKRFI